MCQTLCTGIDWGPEKERGLCTSECTELGLGPRFPDSLLCSLAAKGSWLSGSSSALVELVGVAVLKKSLKEVRLVPTTNNLYSMTREVVPLPKTHTYINRWWTLAGNQPL